jgi:hypothetical protein
MILPRSPNCSTAWSANFFLNSTKFDEIPSLYRSTGISSAGDDFDETSTPELVVLDSLTCFEGFDMTLFNLKC